jgi:hypothetical protein
MEIKLEECGKNYIMSNYIVYVFANLRVYRSGSSDWENKKYIKNLESKNLTYRH